MSGPRPDRASKLDPYKGTDKLTLLAQWKIIIRNQASVPVMDSPRDQRTLRDAIASQFIRYNLPGLFTVFPK